MKTLPLLSISEQRAKMALADLIRQTGGAPPRNKDLAEAIGLSAKRSSALRASLIAKGHYIEHAEVVA